MCCFRTVRVIAVRARAPYTVWLQYADGIEGTVDLTSLAGDGVFSVWLESGRFASVHIDDYGAVSWGDGLEMDPYALYMEITGKSVFGLTSDDLP
jgi:Protein of unknown function (DUF2442)